jgi:predicted Zn-dependent protease
MLIGRDQEMALGEQAYRQVLREEPITRDPIAIEPMQRIVTRLADVADRPDYDWEINVIKDDQTVNAFALPGGKIAVYTGLFPIARTEAGMAVIIGHEGAHALARHAGERMSQHLGARIVGRTLAVGLGVSPYADMILAA